MNNEITIYRFPDLPGLLGLSLRKLRYMVKHGQFPPGHFLVGKIKFWTHQEIEEWIASRPVGTVRVVA